MHRRTHAAVAASAAVLLVPATAQAATVVVPECGRAIPGEQTIPIQGTGFTPNSFVTLRTADGQTIGGAATDAAGNFADTFLGPDFAAKKNRQTLQLTGTDAQGVAAPTVPFQTVKVTATLPERAKPRKRVRFRAFGFVTGQRVYLHVRRGNKTRGSFRIGKAKGACGIASRKLRYMPLRRYSTGNYDYVFQHGRKFDPAQPGVLLRVSIFRRVRFG